MQPEGEQYEAAVGITFANSTNTPYIVNTGHKAVTPQGINYANWSTRANVKRIPADWRCCCKVISRRFELQEVPGVSRTLCIPRVGDRYFKNSDGERRYPVILSLRMDDARFFDNSTINMDGDHSGGTITAASTDKKTSNGIVFLNSTVITANSVKSNPVIDPQGAANANGPANNNMYLGRPWGWQQVGGDASTVFINTKMPAAVRAVGYLNWNAN